MSALIDLTQLFFPCHFILQIPEKTLDTSAPIIIKLFSSMLKNKWDLNLFISSLFLCLIESPAARALAQSFMSQTCPLYFQPSWLLSGPQMSNC
jgi:hypothetical protein